MRISPERRNRGTNTAALCLTALLLAGAPAGAETAARITGLSGAASAGDAPMSLSGAVDDGTSVQTADDGNAAMLVDQRSLVEMCSRTNMKLTRHADTGNRVIEVGAGTTRIIVEPGLDEEHIQIHTPAAIATILGTVVYVTVDPATGETTITSEDNEVKIESADPNVTGSTTISGSEQVTMRPGDAPVAPKRLTRTTLANLAGCLMNFHSLGLTFDRAAWSGNLVTGMATTDAEVSNLPAVGSGPPAAATDPPGSSNEDLSDPADTITPIDTVEIPDEASDDPPIIDEGCGIPGGCDPPIIDEGCSVPGGCDPPIVEPITEDSASSSGVSGSANVILSSDNNIVGGTSNYVSTSGATNVISSGSVGRVIRGDHGIRAVPTNVVPSVSGGSSGVSGSSNVLVSSDRNVVGGSFAAEVVREDADLRSLPFDVEP